LRLKSAGMVLLSWLLFSRLSRNKPARAKGHTIRKQYSTVNTVLYSTVHPYSVRKFRS